MSRLSLETLRGLPRQVQRPSYDVRALRSGIVHLGLGAFHRAHEACYTDAALDKYFGSWGIVGVSLRHADVREQLAPQDGLYTLVEKSPHGTRHRIIGCVRDLVFAPQDRGLTPALIANPQTRIVSLTVTEKGYCHQPASGTLNFSHPDIGHDLAHPDAPRSAIGVLVAGLALRRATRGAPLTVLACDNLPANGRTLGALAHEYAQRLDGELAQWMERHVAFPCSMVDRIVPAATPQLVAETRAALGVDDAAPVQTEAFSQWVIEDRFFNDRPAWKEAGVQFVSDVAPYEEMKLRLLNGSHSLLAYLGLLGGYATVDEAMRDEAYATVVCRYMREEAVPTLRMPAGYDVGAYMAQLVERWRNRALPHRLTQIAMDGSQKIPQRWLTTARANLRTGRSTAFVALGVAAWMRYASGTDEQGRAIAVDDPLAAKLAAIAQAAGDDLRLLVGDLLRVREVFGDDLCGVAGFVAQVKAALASLWRRGARETVRRAVAQENPAV